MTEFDLKTWHAYKIAPPTCRTIIVLSVLCSTQANNIRVKLNRWQIPGQKGHKRRRWNKWCSKSPVLYLERSQMYSGLLQPWYDISSIPWENDRGRREWHEGRYRGLFSSFSAHKKDSMQTPNVCPWISVTAGKRTILIKWKMIIFPQINKPTYTAAAESPARLTIYHFLQTQLPRQDKPK